MANKGASTGKVSIVRQNYHEDSEGAINKQINMELYASYVYQSMVRRRNFFLVYLDDLINNCFH